MRSDETSTETSTDFESDSSEPEEPIPALLVAYKPPDSLPVDHFLLTSQSPFSIGRRTRNNHLASTDAKISKYHAKITREKDCFVLEDLESTNGTYFDGTRITEPYHLSEGSLIRLGHTLLVFHQDARPMLAPLRTERFGIAGQFHVMPLLKQLEEAALSDRHVLLAGPSGSGKELAANAFAALTRRKNFIVYNAARFTSEEEIESTLFGVAPRVFSNVDARAGLIEQAHKGVLFLDEVHNLPERIQKSLLRVIEDGKLTRIGEPRTRDVDIRFVFASNVDGPSHGVTHDFLARLRLVTVPALGERIADIPYIFEHIVTLLTKKHGLDKREILANVSAREYEALCIHRFPEENVRGLADLADRIVTRLKAGTPPRLAIKEIFSQYFSRRGTKLTSNKPWRSFGDTSTKLAKDTIPDTDDIRESAVDAVGSTNVRSRYEQNKDLIIKTYYDNNCVIAATCRALEAMKIKVNPRWLSVFLDRWEVRPQK